MLNKLRFFKQFKFFSLRVLFSNFFEWFIDILSIKKIKFKDKKILFYSINEMTISRAILFGKKEKEVYQFIDRYLEKEDVFFDIGANVGVFSIYSSLFKEAKSVAFEPEYSNLYLLKKNIILNGLKDKIQIYPCSVSNDNNYNFLHLSSFESGAALHSISRDDIELTDENAKVKMKIGTYNISLDDFVKNTGIYPNMLKIDTDGKELEILEGSENVLKNVGYIAFEMPYSIEKRKKCIDILNKNMFKEIEELREGRNIFFKKKNADEK